MSKKCHVGQPVEFKAKYEGIIVAKDGGPDTATIYGLKLTNFSWLQPTKFHIGKGFYVEPDLPLGITHYGPEAYYDLELILTGPGLPVTGQRVTFKWGLSPCLGYGGTVNTKCKQFLSVETVVSKFNSRKFTIEFVTGYTEQQYIKGWNQATWKICYDGPFETLLAISLPNKWEIGRIPLWIDSIRGNLQDWKDISRYDANVQPAIDTIDMLILELIETEVPKNKQKSHHNIMVGLSDVKNELIEVDSMLKRNIGRLPEKEKHELCTRAKERLGKANKLIANVMGMLSRLQRVPSKKS